MPNYLQYMPIYKHSHENGCFRRQVYRRFYNRGVLGVQLGAANRRRGKKKDHRNGFDKQEQASEDNMGTQSSLQYFRSAGAGWH